MSRMESVREVNTRYARMNICHLMVSVDLLPCDENHGRVPPRRGLLGDVPYGNDTECLHPPCDGSLGRAPRAH